ncbi:tripartite tricarboxylate transporter substrate binding protein [Nonomuraea terrae]|uniref:tripartite tricarboxylate transporter substrate binding protein n=1 Tax=Nonomuraea terrae TaxID=2530383 RepID=UPI0037B2BE89
MRLTFRPTAIAAVAVLAASLTACGGNSGAASQESPDAYPSAKIRVIVPYGAGGDADTTMRAVGKFMQKELGQTVVVENKPGGSGAVGTTELISAKPNGYTLALISTGTLVSTPLSNEVGYTKDDVTPLGVLASPPSLLVVKKDSPYDTGEKFFAHAKANPGALKVGVPGATTPQGVELTRLAAEYNVKVTAVPFPGNAELTAALLGGNIDAFWTTAARGVTDKVENGDFLAIATSPEKRVAALPDVPTLAELGFPALTLATSVHGLGAPTGLPAAIATKIEGVLRKAQADPEVRKQLGDIIVTEEFIDGAALKRILDETQVAYEKVIKKS